MDDDDDDFRPTPLIPVSEWVWNLYEVKFWTEEGGRLIKTAYWVGSSENHLSGDVDDDCPHDCRWYEWQIIKKNVAPPRAVGNMYGFQVHESGWSAGARMAVKLKP